MQDKRRYVRWSVCLPVKYKIDGQEDFSSNTKDINSAGLCIYSSQKLIPQRQLDIRIYISEEAEPICAKGEAVWQARVNQSEDENFLVGIKFISIKDLDKDKIFDYLYAHQREEFIKRWWSSS